MGGLTEKEIREGQSISDLFESLTEENKNMCLIYISALRDKQLVSQGKDSNKSQ